MKMLTVVKNIIFVSLISVFIVACGGGGEGSGGSSSSISSRTGIFVDDVVEGIYYKSKSTSGYTNAQGKFPFNNETVEFFVGDIKIGETTYLPTDGYVFIQDIIGIDRDNISNERLINIATFLQSLDSNSSTDKIEIRKEDFDKFSDINKSIEAVNIDDILTQKGFPKRSKSEVQLHLSSTFAKYNKISFDQKEKNFLYNQFHTQYLWADKVEEKPYSQYKDPNQMIEDFKYSTLDKWSYAETFEEYIKDSEQKNSGFGCYFMGTPRIHFMDIDSPCEKAGLKRGDVLVKINSVDVSTESYMKAKENIGVEVVFTVNRNGQLIDLNIIPSIYTYKSSKRYIYDNSGKKIGYFIYNGFTSKSSSEIEESFTYFKENEIDEIIIDLRYNGGGALAVASILLDKLAGFTQEDEIQFYLKDNKNEKISELSFMKDENSLNLSRVFFLTSEHTASASEVVINALKPYLDVVVIGDTTSGKPVGMNSKYISSKYLYWLINFSVYNSKDEGEYYNGLHPNCSVYDHTSFSRGNLEEPLLKEAMTFISYGRCDHSSKSDFDTDGIFDNDDDDDDNDGVKDNEDSHPFNSECSKGNNENKTICYKSLLNSENYHNEKIIEDDDTLLIIRTDAGKIFRYNPINEEIESLIPIQQSYSASLIDYDYLEKQKLLFLTYTNGDVTKIDFNNSDVKEEKFLSFDDYITSINAGDSIVILFSDNNKKYIYDLDGNLLEESDSLRTVDRNNSAFDNTSHKLYSLGYGVSNEKKLKYELLNENNGNVIETMNSSLFASSNSVHLSKNKTKLLIDRKYIVDADTLKWEGSLEKPAYVFNWDENDNIVYSEYSLGDKNTVNLVNKNLELIAKKTFEGRVLNIKKSNNNKYIILRRHNNRLYTTIWTPEEYIKEEKQINFNIDSNYDINEGMSWITSKDIIQNDNILMFIKDGQKEILRYDLNSKKFIDKIVLRDSNIELSKFDNINNILYIVYQNDYISKIDFSKEKIEEEKFKMLSGDVSNFFIKDNLLIFGTIFNGRYVFDLNKNLKSFDFKYDNDSESSYPIYNIKYDRKTNIVYFKNGDKLISGKLNEEGKLFDKNELLNKQSNSRESFYMSKDFQKVFFGDNIHRVDNLEKIKEFEGNDSINIFHWNSDHLIFNVGYSSYKNLSILNSNFQEIYSNEFVGDVIKVLEYNSKYIVITYESNSNTINFNEIDKLLL